MKLSKSLLGAILIGITVQTTSCTKDKDTKPKDKKEKQVPVGCPGCGMG